ncbi:MAG: hypothetical protein PHP65_04505 [Bacilli bacterium]|jgi:hypothetical protein|nr:hypothetical protein [Bacilli bacterium]
MKERLQHIFQLHMVQVVGMFLLALVLIFVSVIFLNDIKAPSNILIYNIFGTLGISSFLENVQLAKNKLRRFVNIGITRRDVYFDYLKRLLFSIVLSLLLVAFYIFIFKLYVDAFFDYSKVIFLPLVAALLSQIGFLVGLFRFKNAIVHIIFGLVVGGLVIVVYFLEIVYYWDILLFVLNGLLVLLNYKIMRRMKL